jgi:protein TIF31
MTAGEPPAVEAAVPSSSIENDQAPEVQSFPPEMSSILKSLVILPPLQKDGTLERDELVDAVPLPPLRAEEPVSSIRAALSEVCGYAHLTSYRLVLEKPPTPSKKTTTSTFSKPRVVSPYTGQNAVVSVPIAVKSLEKEPQAPFTDKDDVVVLDDYGDLTPLLESGLQEGSAFRIVLERYDTALVRDHLTRFRSLLDGNAPSVTSLDEGGVDAKSPLDENQEDEEGTTPPVVENAENNGGKPTDATATKESPDSPTETKSEESPKGADEKTAPAKPVEPRKPQDLPKYLVDDPVRVDGNDLKHFFYLACGEDPQLYSEDGAKRAALLAKKENGSKSAKKKNKKGKSDKIKDEGADPSLEETQNEEVMRETIPRLNLLEEKTRVRCSIRMSGFNPPPQFRRAMGDLAYLEFTPPGESKVIHVTAVPTGFFVNKTVSMGGTHHFDPSPAAEPCFSHELLDCLLQCSPVFRTAWEQALEASKERISLMATLNKDGPFSSLFRVAIRGDFQGYKNPTVAMASEGIDALLQCPSWIVPISRAEEASDDAWARNAVHAYNPSRTEEELSNSFGVDIRSGAVRDWNEELQTAREMPIDSQPERIERAR